MRLGKPALFVMLAIAAAFGVKAVIVESPDERIAILIRDGRTREAIALITARLQSGNGSPTLLRALAALQERAEMPRDAAENREIYLLSEPHDVAAIEAQIALYTSLGDADGLLSNLRRLVTERPSTEAVTRLASLYRLHGRFLDEKEVLASLRGPPALTVDQTERLGMLLASEGNATDAAHALRLVDEAAADERLNSRSLLFGLLCRLGDFDEAARRAVGWLKTWRKPWMATKFALQLSTDAPPVVAARFAENILAIHPEIRFFLAKTIADGKRPALAAELLRGWPAPTESPTADQVANYLAAAVAVGDTTAIWRKFDTIARRRDWLPARAAFAEGILNLFGTEALLGSGRVPTMDVLATRPLFGSRFAMAIGNTPLARDLLARVDTDKVSPEERRVWLSLVRQAFPERDLRSSIAGLRAPIAQPHASRAGNERADSPTPSLGHVAAALAVSDASKYLPADRE